MYVTPDVDKVKVIIKPHVSNYYFVLQQFFIECIPIGKFD